MLVPTPDPGTLASTPVTATRAATPDADRLAAEAVRSMEGAPDPRVRELLTALVAHLHAFVREVRLTDREWQAAIEFLDAAGRVVAEGREEFILLSDTLGVSMLVDLMNHARAHPATESTVLGPFFVADAPLRSLGADIANPGTAGTPCAFRASVVTADGSPIPDVLVDVWQGDGEGYYDVQRSGPTNLRARFRTDAEGKFWFRCVRPVSYPIPCDGPVGAMLKATGRSPVRPGHLHFMLQAPGFETLVTHLFARGDEHLGSDPVFGVKPSLVIDFGSDSSGGCAASHQFVLAARRPRVTPSR